MKCPQCAVYKTAMWRAMKEIRNYVFGDQDGGVQKAYRHLEIAHDAGVLLNAEPAADPRPLPRCPECGADLWTEDENRGHCETCAAREPKNLAAAPSPLTSVLTWVPVSERLPKPHAKYAVMRDGLLFTATPCYGLHEPWWVVRTMPSDWPNEAEPVAIKDTDLWAELPRPPAGETL